MARSTDAPESSMQMFASQTPSEQSELPPQELSIVGSISSESKLHPTSAKSDRSVKRFIGTAR